MAPANSKNNFTKANFNQGPELFGCQQDIFNLALQGKNIYVIKSRQIGMSYLFAWLILCRVAYLGRNQVVVSASKRQVQINWRYCYIFALKLGVKLSGKVETAIIAHNGKPAVIQWLSNNAITAQGYSGDVYFDEFPQNPIAEKLFNSLFPATSLGVPFYNLI